MPCSTPRPPPLLGFNTTTQQNDVELKLPGRDAETVSLDPASLMLEGEGSLHFANSKFGVGADLSFDGDGIATTDLGGDDLATGVAVQPDGKIVVTGATTPSVGVSSYDFSVARYLESLASAYHKLLVWDIMRKPAATRLAEQALNPLIGKSLVVYAVKPGRVDG